MDAFTFLHQYVPLFKEVSEPLLTEIAQASALRKYNPGQTVLFGGMTVDGLHVVATGKVAVFVKVPGKGVNQVAELSMGEVFGEASIISSTTAGATIKAGPEGALVLFISESAFRHLLAEDPAFSARVQALIAARRAPPPKPAS